MSESLEQIATWLDGAEDENLEFKEAKQRYDFEELVRYCAALANEGGGRMVLGITDKRPRKIVGSRAFSEPERTRATLFERLRLRIKVDEVDHPDGRIVVFSVPSREAGTAIQVNGAYWMRTGDSLVPMSPEQLRKIFDEGGPDFSAQICPGASISALDLRAVEDFRARWRRKSGNAALDGLSVEQLLEDAELVADGGVTYAALILFGSRQALGKYLAQAEVIFEYRSSDASLPAQQRVEFREGFFLFYDRLIELINLRNDVQPFIDGLFMRDIPTFNEEVLREAVLNSICHRDYRDGGSTFIRQFPRKLQIESPGGFLPGITPENVLWRQKPRNRRLAEAFGRCGLVERSGQGMNRIVEHLIKEAKPEPDFTGTDDYQVVLTLRGEVRDPKFLRFLERIGQETLTSFVTEDFILLDRLFYDEPVPEVCQARIPQLLDLGIIERVGRGRGARYIPARRLYQELGQKGVYTRKSGLDRQTNKELLFKHIDDNRQEGSRLEELMQVLPALSRHQVQALLRELKAEERIHNTGRTKGSRWYPGPASDLDSENAIA